MKNLFILLCFLYFHLRVVAQQEPHFTQYMSNMSLINPAYATSTPQIINLGSTYRYALEGIKGAPKTLTIFAHTALSPRIESGFTVVSDNIGEGAKIQNCFSADFAYLLQINKTHKFSFGIKAGATMLETNFNGLELNSGDRSTDKAFAENTKEIIPNIGAGAYYFCERYYIGISVPQILTEKRGVFKVNNYAYGPKQIQTYLAAGYVFALSTSFKLKTAALQILTESTDPRMDLSANILYKEIFELGAAYRINNAISALTNINLTRNIRIGYSYDYFTTNLSHYSSGSHEFVLLFNLGGLKRGYVVSPRFF